jgi:hypothetical protein
LLTHSRPPSRRTLAIHVQYTRKPARCQFTTVLGVTKTRGFLHPDQSARNATQNSLCRAVSRGRGRCACRASNCRRRARFSRTRSWRELKAMTNQPRRFRSDTILARILSELSNFAFRKALIVRAYDVLARCGPFLLPPSLNCCLNRGLLRREGVGRIEPSFGHTERYAPRQRTPRESHRVLFIYNLSKALSDEASKEVQEHEHFRT